MKHIRNKNELLAWLEDNAPRKAIANAMLEGKVELFGFFNPVPNSFNAGWIIKVTSKRGLTWNVVVAMDRGGLPIYHAYTVKAILWKNYRSGNTPLFAGDNSEVYKRWKNARPD